MLAPGHTTGQLPDRRWSVYVRQNRQLSQNTPHVIVCGILLLLDARELTTNVDSALLERRRAVQVEELEVVEVEFEFVEVVLRLDEDEAFEDFDRPMRRRMRWRSAIRSVSN